MTDEVESFLVQLVDTLFKEKYFNYLENAIEYVEGIRTAIKTYLPLHEHKRTPQKLLKYGAYFITVTKNKKTTWYIFFDKLGDIYRVNHITNNHAGKSAFIKR